MSNATGTAAAPEAATAAMCKDCRRNPATRLDGRCAGCHDRFVYGEPGALSGKDDEEDDGTDETDGTNKKPKPTDASSAVDRSHESYGSQSVSPPPDIPAAEQEDKGEKAMNGSAWKPSEDAILREEWAAGRGAPKRAAERLEGRSVGACFGRANALGLTKGRAGATAKKKQSPPDGRQGAEEKPKKQPAADGADPQQAAYRAALQTLEAIGFNEHETGTVNGALFITVAFEGEPMHVAVLKDGSVRGARLMLELAPAVPIPAAK